MRKLFLLLIGFSLLTVLTACSQIKRVEKDLYKHLPEGGKVQFKVEACYSELGAMHCIDGQADTLSGAFDNLAKQVTK